MVSSRSIFGQAGRALFPALFDPGFGEI